MLHPSCMCGKNWRFSEHPKTTLPVESCMFQIMGDCVMRGEFTCLGFQCWLSGTLLLDPAPGPCGVCQSVITIPAVWKDVNHAEGGAVQIIHFGYAENKKNCCKGNPSLTQTRVAMSAGHPTINSTPLSQAVRAQPQLKQGRLRALLLPKTNLGFVAV